MPYVRGTRPSLTAIDSLNPGCKLQVVHFTGSFFKSDGCRKACFVGVPILGHALFNSMESNKLLPYYQTIPIGSSMSIGIR